MSVEVPAARIEFELEHNQNQCIRIIICSTKQMHLLAPLHFRTVMFSAHVAQFSFCDLESVSHIHLCLREGQNLLLCNLTSLLFKVCGFNMFLNICMRLPSFGISTCSLDR